MYLLDTNIVINFLDASLSPAAMQFLENVVDGKSNISVITKMETLGFNFRTIPEQMIMETFIDGSIILFINDEVVNKTIEIRKNKKIHLPDAIIAATAIINNLKLVTRNIKDFINIPGLQVINANEL